MASLFLNFLKNIFSLFALQFFYSSANKYVITNKKIKIFLVFKMSLKYTFGETWFDTEQPKITLFNVSNWMSNVRHLHSIYIDALYILTDQHNITRVTHHDFGDWAQRLLLFGYNTNVEDSREDENETRGRCGTWEADKTLLIKINSPWVLTAFRCH